MPLRQAFLFCLCHGLLLLQAGAKDPAVDYELFVYDVPAPKVEMVLPRSWNKDWEKLAAGDEDQRQRAHLMLEAVAVAALDFKVDGVTLPSPTPKVVPLKEEDRGYRAVEKMEHATHVGLTWPVSKRVQQALEVTVEKDVFGSRGLYQSLLESKPESTGLVESHPARLSFAMQSLNKAPKPVPAIQSQLGSYKISQGPSPRMVMWVFLGLLIMVLQVRKSRSVSNRATAIALLALGACFALWSWLSPKIDFERLAAKLPKDKVLDSKKRKEAGQWMDHFMSSLSQPQATHAASYLAAVATHIETADFDIQRLGERPWKLLSFAAAQEPTSSSTELPVDQTNRYQWTATSENWAWGQSDLQVIGGTLEILVEGQNVEARIPQMQSLNLEPKS